MFKATLEKAKKAEKAKKEAKKAEKAKKEAKKTKPIEENENIKPIEKNERFTIGSPNYATLEDIDNNLSDIAQQVEKLKVVDGINNDSILTDINKNITFITAQLENIKNPTESFQNMNSMTTLNLSNYNGETGMKLEMPIRPNSNTLQHLNKKTKNVNNEESEQVAVFIERNLINQITAGAFSIIGLYIVFRAITKK